jgi:hypothetical protein
MMLGDGGLLLQCGGCTAAGPADPPRRVVVCALDVMRERVGEHVRTSACADDKNGGAGFGHRRGRRSGARVADLRRPGGLTTRADADAGRAPRPERDADAVRPPPAAVAALSFVDRKRRAPRSSPRRHRPPRAHRLRRARPAAAARRRRLWGGGGGGGRFGEGGGGGAEGGTGGGRGSVGGSGERRSQRNRVRVAVAGAPGRSQSHAPGVVEGEWDVRIRGRGGCYQRSARGRWWWGRRRSCRRWWRSRRKARRRCTECTAAPRCVRSHLAWRADCCAACCSRAAGIGEQPLAIPCLRQRWRKRSCSGGRWGGGWRVGGKRWRRWKRR